MPREILGGKPHDFTSEELIYRLGGSLLVGVDLPSPQVAQILAERDD